jgi:IS30 family transposase
MKRSSFSYSQIIDAVKRVESGIGVPELNSTAYFARPFASWERGSNENLNGLLRQYIPMKLAMSTVSDEEIRMIQNRLNNRPRKRLGFKTPAVVFHQSLKRVALELEFAL